MKIRVSAVAAAAVGALFAVSCAAPIPPPPPVVGDVNGDGLVGCIDQNAVLAQWEQTGPGLAADLNRDETVDFEDLLLVLNNYTGDGTSTPPNPDGSGGCG